MATNVKFLRETENGKFYDVLDAPYKEEITVKSVNAGIVTIEGTATLSVMSYFKMVDGLLSEESNFSEEIGEKVCAICTKLNGTEVTIKKADDEDAVYRQWKNKRKDLQRKSLQKLTKGTLSNDRVPIFFYPVKLALSKYIIT